MKKIIHISTAFACTLTFASGCNQNRTTRSPAVQIKQPQGADTEKKCYGIVNGATTNDYPSVVNLIKPFLDNAGQIEGVGSCTGTFVSSTTLITASHCVDNSVTGGIGLNLRHLGTYPASAEEYQALSRDLVSPLKVTRLIDMEANPNAANIDVAVVVFPKGTAPAISKLLLRPAKKGDPATIIGFGMSTSTDEKDKSDNTLQKRMGSTSIMEDATSSTLWSRLTGGMIITQGANRASSTQQTPVLGATTAPGDSGGPLFINNALAAVTEGGRPGLDGSIDYAQYVDISSAAVTAFFKQVNSEGASIPMDEASQGAAAAELNANPIATTTNPFTPSTPVGTNPC